MNLVKECSEYFQDPGFERFIDAWMAKYKSLGYLGGRIQLNNLTNQEREVIGSLIGQDLGGKLSLTYREFQKQLAMTKFEEVDFLEVLKNLSSSPLYTNKEMIAFKNQKIEEFQQALFLQFKNTKAYLWLNDYFQENKQVSSNILTNHQYKEILTNVCYAINHLPIYQGSYELIPVFSQLITKDPHYFDKDLPKELLLKAIEYLFQLDNNTRTIEDVNEIFYRAGLLKDDLSNNCYICHLLPQTYLLSWQGFYENYEPWNMNLYNLTQVHSLFQKTNVYVIENPSVFRMLVTYIKNNNIDVGLICSNGQINLCTYMLMDKLTESGCHLYYAGDYDPEGLLIADKLKSRYQDNLELWCYDISYLKDIMINQVTISSKRLQILKHIHDSQLQIVSSYIIKNSCFGYQEGLIDIYKHNLK